MASALALADDPNYNSEEDEDYQPEVAKSAKAVEVTADQREAFSLRSGLRADGKRPLSPSPSSPRRQKEDVRETEGKKAKVDSVWEDMKASGAVSNSSTSKAAALLLGRSKPKGKKKKGGLLEFKPPSLSVDRSVVRSVNVKNQETAQVVKFAGQNIIVTKTSTNTPNPANESDKANAKKIQLPPEDLRARIRAAAKKAVQAASPVGPTTDGEQTKAAPEREAPPPTSISALDQMVEVAQGKVKKITTIEKSNYDWDKFKKEEKIEDELEQYTKDGYIEKQQFLQRVDSRQFEVERAEREKQRKAAPRPPV